MKIKKKGMLVTMEKIKIILKQILGESEYSNLVETIHEELNKNNLNNDEIIVTTHLIVILLIGFSKKQVNIDYYYIHLLNNSEIKCNIKRLLKKYGNYINEIENFKINLLRQII